MQLLPLRPPLGWIIVDLPHAAAAHGGEEEALAAHHLGQRAHLLVQGHFVEARVLAEQVGHIDAEVVQLDEANLPGHPEEWEWAAEAINLVLDAVKKKPAVHLCFVNYGGQSVQSGTWDKLINYLNLLHVDHIVMETAHRPLDELAVFKELRPEIGFGLGVVDIKVNKVESADEIARAIEGAEQVLGAGRVTYINPDCGFWMLPRSVADGKIKALVEGRDLYEGRRHPPP